MDKLEVAIAVRSYFNNPHCGDQCAYWKEGNRLTLCVVDGLGHGEHAEAAAKAAIAYVGNHLSESLTDIFAGCNTSLRSTRGAVMGISVIDQATNTLTFAGVGNIEIRVLGGESGQMSSNPGIVGGGYRRISPETIPMETGHLVLMFTDGVTGKFDVSGYDDAVLSDTQRFADRMIEDWGRETDDSGILIFRYESS